MITRYASSLSFAVCITFSLLFFMQLLIATGISPIGTTVVIDPPSLPTRRPDTEVQVEEEVVPPPEVEPPPEIIEIVIIDDRVVAPLVTDFRITKIELPIRKPGQLNGGIIAVAIMQPEYPRRAQQRGLEGYVIVEFTVSSIGKVIDATVLDSSSSLFEQSALRAVARFKYKPQVVDGIAIDTPGVRYMFSFSLED
jgi:protein TonB